MTRLLCCAAALALVACARDATPSAAGDSSAAAVADSGLTARDVTLTPAQASRIHVATVTMQAYRPVVQTTGTVEFNGDRSTQVLAPVSGPITRILVNPGAEVQRGQALATVTSPDFAAATAAYRKAQAAYVNAQRIADLDAQLFRNDAIPRRELEQAQTDAASAAADRDAAIEQMRALGVDESSIAAVRENRAGAPTQAVIRAPISGTVVEKLVNPGQLIQAGSTPCFTIADLSSVWVMANVFESDMASVAAGQSATITTAALPTPITGQVTYVSALVDPASKAAEVRILAPNPRGVLKRDMLVNVAIRAAEGRNGLLIPVSAVMRDDQNLPFVYVARPNNHYGRRQVTLGARTGDQYEVTAGLSAGERIVVDGALFLQFAGSQ
ncbi:MAG TPA: efflux RND transporter periplasmic adaptor subunit [Gemmatimonadaceae bacterium]